MTPEEIKKRVKHGINANRYYLLGILSSEAMRKIDSAIDLTIRLMQEELPEKLDKVVDEWYEETYGKGRDVNAENLKQKLREAVEK